MKLLRKLALLLICLGSVGTAYAQTTTFNGIVKDLTTTPVPVGNVNFTLKPGVATVISGNAQFTPSTVICEIHNPAIVSTSGTTTITVVVGTAQNWLAGDKIIFVGTGDATLDASSVASPYTITVRNSSTSFSFTQSGTHTNGAVGTVGGMYATGGTGGCAVAQNSALNPAYTSYQVAVQPGTPPVTVSSFNTYAIGSGPIDISTIVPTPSQQPAYSFVDLFSNGQTISGLKSFTNTGNTYSGGTFTNPIINNAIFNTTTATNWTLVTPTIQQPTFTTQPITLVSTFNYSLSWAVPAAARSISIIDPGGTDAFVFGNANQTLTNKQFGSGITFTANPASVNGATTAGPYGIAPIVAQANVTGRSTSIGTTTLYTYVLAGSQALAVVDYSEVVTSGAGGGGTLSLVINWTDCVAGAMNQLVYDSTTGLGTISLVTTGAQVNGTMTICPANGTVIGYTTTDSTPGTGIYSLRLRAKLE